MTKPVPKNASSPLSLLCFSDVLCFWAYASQIRFDEALTAFGDKIELKPRFISIFGSVRDKFSRLERSGGPSYNVKAVTAQERYPHVQVHPDLWLKNVPSSSTPCHLFLCAIDVSERERGGDPKMMATAAWQLRLRFFRDLVDISTRSAQFEVAEELGLPIAPIEKALQSGIAHALLAEHGIESREHTVNMSPTLILDGGRQRLAGNVGYRVIEANISELIERPANEHSWC